MADAGIKELLEAGVHFGHQTARWNPSMRRYIYGERDGIHVIDLLQTEQLLKQATEFASELAGRGGKVLFVGTKKQARDSVEEWAEKSGMPYVSRRWLGGLLTNFHTINKRIGRLHDLTNLKDDGQLALLPTKERMAMEAELAKLEFNLGGVRGMERVPDAMVVIDINTEEIAVAEALRLGIPIIGLVDSNCTPKAIDFVVPGNDDAIRSCGLIVGTIGEAILGSATAWQQAEDARLAREAEEKRKRAEAERERREAKAKAEAEAKAKAEAAAKAQAEALRAGAPAQAKGQPKQAVQPKQGQAPKKPREKPVPVSKQTPKPTGGGKDAEAPAQPAQAEAPPEPKPTEKKPEPKVEAAEAAAATGGDGPEKAG